MCQRTSSCRYPPTPRPPHRPLPSHTQYFVSIYMFCEHSGTWLRVRAAAALARGALLRLGCVWRVCESAREHARTRARGCAL